MRGFIPVAAACAIAAAFVISATPTERLPQRVSGDDALSVAFGDAKDALSVAMARKADSYFHGGVDIECTLDDDHGVDGPDHASCASHHAGAPDCGEAGHVEAAPSRDPWAWINRHVRAPQVERHLEGARAVELMPWFWAAVKADPHNVDAWTEAWYIAAFSIGNEKLAAGILADAKKANPDNLEIAFTEGRAFYKGGRGDLMAAERAFEAARALGRSKGGGRAAALSSNEQLVYANILDYLSVLAEKRRDILALESCLSEVRTLEVATPAVESIARRLGNVAGSSASR